MGTVHDVKCRKCGYEDKVKSGDFSGRRFYNFYGCPKCKKIISVDIVNDTEASMDIKAGKCPECKGKLIDYMSKEQEGESKDKDGKLCPRCMNYTLKFERKAMS